MTLKEIIPLDEQLIKEGTELLEERDMEIFKSKYEQVIKKLIDYRNKYIKDYIIGLKTKGDDYMAISGPIEIYTVKYQKDLDETGVLIEKLMDKCIHWDNMV